MPVKANKNRKSAVLTCDGCGVKATFKSSSPAAPELSACEEAAEVGWSFNVGFFAMLVGHTVYCPTCTKGGKT